MPVKAHTLADHHRRCDALFEAALALAGGPAAELVARVGALREALLDHFGYEELHIFPLYEQASGVDGATDWLRAQHDDMRSTLWTLGTLSPQEDRAAYLAELATLKREFDAHAAEEESRMYPIFERLLAK